MSESALERHQRIVEESRSNTRRAVARQRISPTRTAPTGTRKEMATIIPGVPQWVEDAIMGTASGRAQRAGAGPIQYRSVSGTGVPGGVQPNFEYFTSPNGGYEITGSGPGGSPYRGRRRRRRRKLLTCSDKADIAFLHGQLGGGALGRSAISSLLSRRCG